ncbi:MAG: hypothetical protein JW932_20050 [Deltaproteobacteria bacterium]|nr:hypothetical protein [Deltaproteobacteria bacterium]
MDIVDADKLRKQRFAYFCIAFSLLITIGFTIVDFIEGDTIEALINILMGMVLIGGFYALKTIDKHLPLYRLTLTFLSVIFFYNVIIGSGNGTVIYWLSPFPLMFMFFLGKREGVLTAGVFFGVLCMLLINPFSFKIHEYSVGTSLRFLVALLLVMLMAYGLETSRDKFARLLIEKHEKLLEEKQHLQEALGEIKTLSGLIPICSNCKKIRDDKGYWQQVEIYVKNHSSADFSHGICPDCLKKLYPDLDDSTEEQVTRAASSDKG